MKSTLNVVIYALTAGTMLAVGLELEVARIPELVRRKLLLAGLLLGQLFLVPAIAVFLVRLVAMPAETAIVVLMLAACPTGNVANFFTLLARGNLALSVLSSAISCLLAPLTMPVIFAIYGKLLGGSFPFMVPSTTLLARIFALTWAPILLGVALRQRGGEAMARFSLRLRRTCVAGTVVFCLYIAVTRVGLITAELKTNVTVSAGLIFAALAAGILIAKALRLGRDEAICYATAFPARNIGVLAVVTVATLQRFNDLIFVLVCFVLESLVLLTAVVAYRGRSLPRAIST